MVIDHIASHHSFGPWRKRFHGLLSEGRLDGTKIFLLKPQTHMNASGRSVDAAVAYYKLGVDEVVVFHDEIDLAPARVRSKVGGGNAGHNGLKSIDQHIGAGYLRVRIGIGHPGHRDLVVRYVLSNFAVAEQDWVRQILAGIAKAVPNLAAGQPGAFLNQLAQERQTTQKVIPNPSPHTKRTILSRILGRP